MSALYPDLPQSSFPDSVQNFVTMLNMVAEDGESVQGYQEAMQNGDMVLAQQYYSQITNANQKFIDANKMNSLMQTCIALQRFYDTDIEPYVDSQHTNWENRINQFNYVGVYSSTRQYQVNNFVIYTTNSTNNIYICISLPPVGTAPTNTTYWRQLSIKGLQGVSGDGLSFQYSWNSAQNYYLQDVVTYNNAIWGCIQENINQTPEIGSEYWNLIYVSKQTLYPFQTTAPTSGISVGDLWLQIVE